MRPNRPRNLFRSRGRARNLGEARYIPKAAELARRNPHVVRPGTIQEVQVWQTPIAAALGVCLAPATPTCDSPTNRWRTDLGEPPRP